MPIGPRLNKVNRRFPCSAGAVPAYDHIPVRYGGCLLFDETAGPTWCAPVFERTTVVPNLNIVVRGGAPKVETQLVSDYRACRAAGGGEQPHEKAVMMSRDGNVHLTQGPFRTPLLEHHEVSTRTNARGRSHTAIRQ